MTDARTGEAERRAFAGPRALRAARRRHRGARHAARRAGGDGAGARARAGARHSRAAAMRARSSGSAAIPRWRRCSATRLCCGTGRAILLHEQNAVLGRANRALARFADVLALSHAHTAACRRGVTDDASPAIRCARAIRRWPAAPISRRTDELRLLVLGGSLGARVFSDVVPPALAAAARGAARAAARDAAMPRRGSRSRARGLCRKAASPRSSRTFFTDVAARLARRASGHRPRRRLHGRRTRGGRTAGDAGAAAESRSTTIRRRTRAALADAGAAWLMPQPTFTPPRRCATGWNRCSPSPPALAEAAARAAALGHADAAARLADSIEADLTQESVGMRALPLSIGTIHFVGIGGIGMSGHRRGAAQLSATRCRAATSPTAPT